MHSSRYRVKLAYREPGYAEVRGIEERAYVGAFEVSASDPDEAVAVAVRLFHEAQRVSGVSWAREILAAHWSPL